VGIRPSAGNAQDRVVSHEDGDVIDLVPVTESNGKVVYRQLQAAAARTGVPRAIVSDGGHDLHAGAERFRAAHPATAWLYDIKHKTACLLKHALEHDASWPEFVEKTHRFQQQVSLGPLAETAQHQNQGHQGPGDLCASRGDRAVEELLQAHLIDEFQSQPRATEIAALLHAHALDVHFHPLRLQVVEEPLLPRSAPAFGRFLDAQPLRFVELPEIGHHALPRATRRAIRLQHCPVSVPLAVLSTITRAEEHARILCPPSGVPKGKVFTTTP